MPFPVIRIAIPKRRYQLGEFLVSVLGEIDSGDAVDYRYIAAFVKEGENTPQVYVTAESSPPGERGEGRYRLRLLSGALEEVMSTDDCWSDLELFSKQALEMGRQLLGLGEEEAYRLL